MDNSHHASTPHSTIQTIKDSAEQYSIFILLAILILSLLSTRTVTEIQSWSHATPLDGRPCRVRKLPYWVPGIGHALSYAWRERGFLLDAQYVLEFLKKKKEKKRKELKRKGTKKTDMDIGKR